ncbi:MAG: FAD-dependent oxidoreductase, partial [Thermohalobaculum sp.]|nr:FAD-dependent oxidoreductase [Thermohalobaculum sp.]
HVVLAAGWHSLGILPAAHQPTARQPDGAPAATGVKGQAALMAARLDPAAPVIQAGGLFIVPHAGGRVAVGATSEKQWTAPDPDAALDALIAGARALAPALRDAPVIARWAGIRPKAPGREPLVGPLPGAPRLLLATGGYKVGFGIAHLVGDALAALIAGDPAAPALPPDFAPAAHGLCAPTGRI